MRFAETNTLPPDAKLGIFRSTQDYNPSMACVLMNAFSNNLLEMQKRLFDNSMPLYTVEEADHALLVFFVTGDNLNTALADLYLFGNAATIDVDRGGPNVRRLGYMFPFFDGRQDKKTRKPVPSEDENNKSEEEVAIVKSQYVFTEGLARMIRAVDAQYVVTLDIHSHDAAGAFAKNNVDLVNLTAMRLFADLMREKGLVARNNNSIVCTTDVGGINRAHALCQMLDLPLAVIAKKRHSSADGTRSTTEHKLVFGDISGKRVILPDDMISSGGTLLHAIELLLKLGAEEIIVCATHPVFTDGYYANLKLVLGDDRVKLVAVTNSLPIEERQSGYLSVPYVGKGENKKQVEVVDISGLLITAARVLLSTDNIETAKKMLGDDVLDNADPYVLYKLITGQTLPKPKAVGVYRAGGHVERFPE